MILASYTRYTSCVEFDDIPADIIKKQNDAIEDYCSSRNLKVSIKYSDKKHDYNDETAFRQMVTDAVNKKFDAVIVSSVYRAGSIVGSAQEVLGNTLYRAGIRFIVVEDDFDSEYVSSEQVNDYFKTKNGNYQAMMVKHRMLKRAKEGRLMRNDQKYGYILSDDAKTFVVHEETASVIRFIFESFDNGKTYSEIADVLTKKGAITPAEHQSGKIDENNPHVWKNYMVSSVIHYTYYLGKWKKSIYGVLYEFNFEPIISRELFDRVNSKFIKADNSNNRPQNIFSGLVKDSENPDRSIVFVRTDDGRDYFKYRFFDKENKSAVYYSYIYSKVLEELRHEYNKALDIKKKLATDSTMYLSKLITETNKSVVDVFTRIANTEKFRMYLYNTYGMQDKSYRYASIYSGCVRKKGEVIAAKHCKEIKDLELTFSADNPWLKLYLQVGDISSLDRKAVFKYIKRINIHDGKLVSIELRNNEWYEKLPEEWRA